MEYLKLSEYPHPPDINANLENYLQGRILNLEHAIIQFKEQLQIAKSNLKQIQKKKNGTISKNDTRRI